MIELQLKAALGKGRQADGMTERDIHAAID
jgi:hypothetical protein